MSQLASSSQTAIVHHGWEWSRNEEDWTTAGSDWPDLYHDFSTSSPLQDPRKQAEPVILQLKKRISYSTNDQIYVRKCYANTLSRIQSTRSAYPMSGIVLTGQPGTGALSHITLNTHSRAEMFLREKSLAALCPPSLSQSGSRACPPLSPFGTPSILQRHCLQAYPWTRGSRISSPPRQTHTSTGGLRRRCETTTFHVRRKRCTYLPRLRYDPKAFSLPLLEPTQISHPYWYASVDSG